MQLIQLLVRQLLIPDVSANHLSFRPTVGRSSPSPRICGPENSAPCVPHSARSRSSSSLSDTRSPRPLNISAGSYQHVQMVGQQVPFLGPAITGVSKRDRNFLPACEVSDKHNSIINRVVNGRGQPLHYGLVIFGTDLKGSSVIAPRPNTCYRFRVTRVSPCSLAVATSPLSSTCLSLWARSSPKAPQFRA